MIVIVSRTEGSGSGAEIVLNHLLDSWPVKNSLCVVTAKSSSVALKAKAAGFLCHELQFVPERILPNLRELERVVPLLRSAASIHAWNSKSFEISWYLAQRTGLSLTCTMHDHPDARFYTKKKRWLMKRIANSCEKIACVSGALRKECSEFGYRRPMEVIYNGLPDLAFYNSSPAPSKKLRIGFLGMGSNVKGFELVADWIAQTISDPDIEWHLYGDLHSDYTAYMDRLNKLPVKNFLLHGRQPQEKIFTEVDLIVSPSTQFDAFPTVLLEASKYGLPAIAADYGGAVEIIEEGKTGFLFNTSDKDKAIQSIRRLKNDPQLFQSLSGNTRERFNNRFGVNNMVKQYQLFWNLN